MWSHLNEYYDPNSGKHFSMCFTVISLLSWPGMYLDTCQNAFLYWRLLKEIRINCNLYHVTLQHCSSEQHVHHTSTFFSSFFKEKSYGSDNHSLNYSDNYKRKIKRRLHNSSMCAFSVSYLLIWLVNNTRHCCHYILHSVFTSSEERPSFSYT